MIKTRKSLLFSFFSPPALAVTAAILAIAFNFTPPGAFSILAVIILILASLFLFYLTYKKTRKEYARRTEFEETSGKINIACEQLEIEELRNKSLRDKITRYDSLALLTERLNQNLSLEDTAHAVTESAYILIGGKAGSCRLYLSRGIADDLYLAAGLGNLPAGKGLREKQTDLLDEWTLKHLQPLLVEDIAADFRFDPDRLKKETPRKIGSLISTCLISQKKPIGILRLDNPRPKYFNLEDLRLLNTISDIAAIAIDNSRYYQHAKELSITDSLTNLYTRKFTLERLEEEVQRSLISENPLSVAMIDIDFFKKYNDLYGHLAGDIVLRSLSAGLKESFKDKDYLIGRLGGEEFLIILPATGKSEAFSRLENTRGVIQEKNITLRRKTTRITISCGIAACPTDAKASLDLLNKSDIALYEAKKTGRNKVCLF